MTNTATQPPAKPYPCPRCQQPTLWQDNPFRPFCSDRCKLIDLGAWANEDYRMPTDAAPFNQDFR